MASQKAVPKYEDTRDITSFSRRAGRLPEQKEGDALDYRGLLNRDGSVLTTISPEALQNPQQLRGRRLLRGAARRALGLSSR